MCEKVKFRFGPSHGIRRGKVGPVFFLSSELPPPPISSPANIAIMATFVV